MPIHHAIAILLLLASNAIECRAQTAAVPRELRPWLEPQPWNRDVDAPIVALGKAGEFDDTHIFAPAVAYDGGSFLLWYCGSTGAVDQRVFRLGLSISADGRAFDKCPTNPVADFGDGKRSVLTPTLLRNPDGTVLREQGKLRMWFSSTDFQDNSGVHTLHEMTSTDGLRWSPPSPALLEGVYAPTVLKTGRTYQIWYTDVTAEPWVFRHATSIDGKTWRLAPETVLRVDQHWEQGRLFYPTVLKIDGAYLMWYGSYWSQRDHSTALGFAVSLDGMQWIKHPQNPVLRPDPERPWESNYVTSQAVMRLAEGGFRMWYASRKKPPFVNKYFAINTASWSPAKRAVENGATTEPHLGERRSFLEWRNKTRQQLTDMLGIPKSRVALDAERRGEFAHDGIVVEKWIFTSEPGSRVPAVLYRPQKPDAPMPALVLTFGHGGSKSQWQYNYAGQVFAKMGLACLALDPIGEEERHAQGRLGTRAHDPKGVHDRADSAGRLIMGKLLFDTIRGIDFLMQRDDIDHGRIGVAGNSLGGAIAGWMAAIEPRIKAAIVSGWAYHDIALRSKYCTKVPNQRMRPLCTWTEYAALAAPECALLIANGDADWIIDSDNDGSAWRGTRQVVAEADRIHRIMGNRDGVTGWFECRGGHRPYFVYKEALEWIHGRLGTPGWTLAQIRALATINSGTFCDSHGIELERLYGTPLHQRGASLPDLGIRPIPRERIACLHGDELGSPEFTIEGWLDMIEEEQ